MKNSPIFESFIEDYNNISIGNKLSVLNDCASFCVDEKFDVHIVFFDETQSVHIISYIKIIAENTRQQAYEILLEANYLAVLDGSFSITPDKKYIAYNESYPIVKITPFELEVIIYRVIKISQKTLFNYHSI
ncbi:type III secretion system chaperone [Shewanella surugensis]|uniref:Type III secretion system chaperone n=1 Tax=Shewanella surugensis TaxID=212020 RepID=A0ABT0L711_9GAMM|nr:type III secretion system chaperone [Shewanella surugensis]MCL1123354.1 type III secretion system chaperone [Shewanella surugensis]